LEGESKLTAENAKSRNKTITTIVIVAIILVVALLAYRYFSEKTRLLNAGRYYTYGVNKFKESQGIPIDPADTSTTTTAQPTKPIDREVALEAVDNFRQSVGFDNQRADSWVGMAEVYTKLNEFEKTIEVLEEAAEVKYESVSNKVTVLTALGDAYFRVGRYEDAAKAYDDAIKASPKNPIVALAYSGKVLAKLESGDLSEVGQFTEWVRNGQELDSRAENQHIYHFALGWTYEARGRMDQALAEYKEAISYNDKYPRLLYRTALLERSQGLFLEPYLRLRLAVENSEASGVTYIPAVEALAELDKELSSKSSAEQAAIHVEVANYYYVQDSKNTEKITALYKKVLETDDKAPASALAYARLASILLDTRVDEELEANAVKAIDMTEKGVSVATSGKDKSLNYVVMSKAKRIQRDFDGAIAVANKAIEADPENYRGYLELAMNFYEAYSDFDVDVGHDPALLPKYEDYLYQSRDVIQKAKELVTYDREVESYSKRIDRAIDRLEKEKAEQ
jgi:tetratricopeptide (TPR) repeat protein